MVLVGSVSFDTDPDPTIFFIQIRGNDTGSTDPAHCCPVLTPMIEDQVGALTKTHATFSNYGGSG